MRVKPTGGGPPPVEQPSESTAATGATAVDGATGAGGPSEISSTAATGSAHAADSVSEVARRLRTGEISPREAVELLIDDAVRRQVGPALGTRTRLANELKELLRRYTETDPYLASKVRRLGKTR